VIKIRKNNYGKRWPATEEILSSVKRMCGEYIKSRKKQNMYNEAKLKFWTYQQVKEIK